MIFNEKRFLQLAGIRIPSQAVPSSTKALSESRRAAGEGRLPEEDQLRAIIRQEAKRMLQERAARGAVEASIEKLQWTKSLVESIALGFGGPGFGNRSHILGGPMTSAASIHSLAEAEEPEEESSDEGSDDDEEQEGEEEKD